ncbi:hypothetical protein OROGR_018134 [Orobanche gracilis]
MGLSAVLRRRWISGLLRSRGDATSNWTVPYRGLVANQTITATGVSGTFRSAISNYSSSAAAPWLMLESQYNDSLGDWTYRFHSCAEAKTYTFLKNRRGDCFRPNMLAANVVGSSRGWIAVHNVWREKNDLFLSDPTTFRLIDLPPLEPTARLRSLILEHRRDDGNAFVISNSGMIYCSPGRSRQWTPFGSCGGAYESLVYSSHHHRLFSLTSASDLEAWDVKSEQPRLERTIPLYLGSQRPGLTRAVYLVRTAEQSGIELFVVVRFVKTGGGFRVGREQYVVPTVDFEVYEVDLEREMAVKMEKSLGGLTMFVGLNEGVAVRDVRGLRRDAIYFAYDKRGCYERRGDSEDVGIFDYEKGRILPIHPMGLRRALWFTPAI